MTKSVRTLSDIGAYKWLIDNSILHREDGPAIEYPDGDVEYWQNDELHREGGPAVIYRNMRVMWWMKRGYKHRLDGPAVIRPGQHFWYVEGKKCRTPTEYQKAAGLSDEDMTILLLKYNFTNGSQTE